MAEATIVADRTELRNSARKLDTGREDIDKQLADLKRMIDQLVQSSFKGGAAPGKFRDSYEQWDKGAKNAIAGLNGMKEFLNKAAQGHDDLDTTLSSSVS